MAITAVTYRALASNGDYTFGLGTAQGFLSGTNAIAQAIKTRLLLYYGEWFLDTTDGLPLWQQILGASGANIKIVEKLLQERILGTEGVTSISSFTSTWNSANRSYTFVCNVVTVFSTTITITNG